MAQLPRAPRTPPGPRRAPPSGFSRRSPPPGGPPRGPRLAAGGGGRPPAGGEPPDGAARGPGPVEKRWTLGGSRIIRRDERALSGPRDPEDRLAMLEVTVRRALCRARRGKLKSPPRPDLRRFLRHAP